MIRRWLVALAVLWIVLGFGVAEAAPPIALQLEAQPAKVKAGGSTVLTVVARSGSSGAVLPGVAVHVRASGGHFGFSAREARGVTDEQGLYRVVWHAEKAETYVRDTSYVIIAKASVAAHADGRGSLPLTVLSRSALPLPIPRPGVTPLPIPRPGVTPLPIPRPGVTPLPIPKPKVLRDLVLKVKATPERVAAGGSTVLTLLARTPEGEPVAGATVYMAAGGGSFAGAGAGVMVSGTTDETGAYRATWRTAPPGQYKADASYVFLVEVSMAGFRTASSERELQVTVVAPDRPDRPDRPPTLRPMGMQVSTRSPSVKAGGSATIMVRVHTSAGEPLPRARVRISVGGGSFWTTRTATVDGFTDGDGLFRAVWTTEKAGNYRADTTYRFEALAEMTGYRSARDSMLLTVRAARSTAPARPPVILVSASVESPRIAATGATRIVVRASTPGRRALAGAAVQINCGGGVFDGARGPSITGLTGADGIYRAVWRPGDPRTYRADLTYTFGVRVTKAGHQAAAAETRVTVLAHKTAPVKPPATPTLLVRAVVQPSPMEAGAAGQIIVQVRNAAGTPLAGASVTIVSDGGFFRNVTGKTARGVTDASGVFRIQWRTEEKNLYIRDRTHPFTIEGTKAGFSKGTARTSVLVRAFRVR